MENTNYSLYSDIEYFEYLSFLLKDDELIHDLHIHTSNSDGIQSLEYTCEKISESSIQFFCITDHNYMFDNPPKCIMATNKLFIYGTELSCCYEGNRVHIIGYFLNTDNKNTKCIISKIHQGHCEREKIRISNMQKKSNIKLTYDRYISEHGMEVPNWRRIAESLVSSGDAVSLADASEKFLKKGKSGYLSYSDNWPKVDVREVVLAIMKDGGLPVIAHLGDLACSMGIEKTIALVSELKQCGLVGYDISDGEKHQKIPESIEKICKKQFHLLPFYGTDCHDARFKKYCEKVSISWLNILLVKYAHKYLDVFFSYDLIDLIQSSIMPEFNFARIPMGYIQMLKVKNVNTFEDLLRRLSKKDACNVDTLLCIIVIINCLSFLVAEKQLKRLISESLNEEKSLEFLKNYFENKIKDFKISISRNSLDIGEKKKILRIWIPIFYRINMYDEANELLNQTLRDSNFEAFIDFQERFSLYMDKHSFDLELNNKFFDNILENFSKEDFTERIINRNLKSYASCYQKYVKCYLLEKNPKIPTSLNDVYFNNDIEFFEIFEDLSACTIITKYKIKLECILKIFNKNRFRTKIKYYSDVSRRWYHQRIIILLQYNKVISEILVKTEEEYWFAYYYYWRTKNYLLFDIKSFTLKDKISVCGLNADNMTYIALEDLLNYIRNSE